MEGTLGEKVEDLGLVTSLLLTGKVILDTPQDLYECQFKLRARLGVMGFLLALTLSCKEMSQW